MRNQIQRLRDGYKDKYRKALSEDPDFRSGVQNYLEGKKLGNIDCKNGYEDDPDFKDKLSEIVDKKGYDEIEFGTIGLKNHDLQIIFLYISFDKLLLRIRDTDPSERGNDWDRYEEQIKVSINRLVLSLNSSKYILVRVGKFKKLIEIKDICLHASRLSVIHGLAMSLGYLKWIQANLHHTNSKLVEGKRRRARNYFSVYRTLLLKDRNYNFADCSQDVWGDRANKGKIASYLHKKYMQLLILAS